MDWIGALIFLVIIIASMAQKFQEQRALRQEKERQKGKTSPKDLPEATRRMIYGSPGEPRTAEPRVREAKPRGSTQPHRERPEDPAREMLETLFGAGKATEEEEGDWIPVSTAPQRTAPKRSAERQPAAAQRPTGDVRKHIQAQREESEEKRTYRQSEKQAHPRKHHLPHMLRREAHEARERATQEERRKQIMEERARLKRERAKAQQAKQRPVRQVAPAPQQRAGMFNNLDDIRRAIVFAEILGPPRAYHGEIRPDM